MSVTIREDQILKACVALDGTVWYADGVNAPLPSGADVLGFVESLKERNPLHVRVLGTTENAELITLLYQRYCSAKGTGRLELASPMLCETYRERQDPEVSLYRMRQCLLSSSLGGWHRITPADYPSYAMAACLNKTGGRVDGQVLRLLNTHPVWHDLRFLSPPVHADAVAKLLSLILDPRWFVDQQNPYRIGQLQSFLGLSPKVQWAVSTGCVDGLLANRCALVLAAWRTRYPDDKELKLPGAFLWRRWSCAGGGSKGDLRAGQAFLVYLVRNWQHHLFHNAFQPVEMFLPEKLLKQREIKAYREHASQRVVPV